MKKFFLLSSFLFFLNANLFCQIRQTASGDTSTGQKEKSSKRQRYKMKDFEKSETGSNASLMRFLETTALLSVIFFSPHAGVSFSSGGNSVKFSRKRGSKSVGSK